MTLIFLTISTFLLLLWLLSYLLSDFRRFLGRITRDLFFSYRNKGVLYMGEVVLTFFVCIIIAMMALIFLKSVTAFVAWLFSKDLIDFFTIMRQVFTTTSVIRAPLQYFVPSVLVLPCVQFVTVFLIFRSIRTFFTWVNRKYEGCYSESDSLYFGLFVVILLILMEIFLFAQNMKQINVVIVHFSLLASSKISYLIHYLTLSHINYLYCDDYRNSLSKYVIMNKTEEWITFSPFRAIAFTYVTNILLLLPFYCGVQFLRSNLQVFIFFLMICTAFVFLLRSTMSKGLNFLGTIALNKSLDISIITDNFYKLSINLKKLLIVLLLIISVFFCFIHWDLFLMTIILASLPILLACVILILVYCLGSLFPNIHSLLKEGSVQIPQIEVFYRYFYNIFIAVGKAVFPFCITVFCVFMLLSVFPKPLIYNNPHISKSLVDNNNAILYIDRSQESDYCIPLSYTDIPPFLIQCIINQEDRNFMRQNEWLPNSSNWHGLSPAFFFRNRGGSNINMQLIKNLSFESSFPQDLSRKVSELFAAYQLSIAQDKNYIITCYVNSVGFHGARGFQGLEAATLYVFGRPVNQLNYLEQMYLVSTLPRNKKYALRDRKLIDYGQTKDYSAEIKQTLIDKSISWQQKGLISRKELNIIKFDSLFFTNQYYSSGISSSSRLFFEKKLAPYRKAKYIGSLTEQNQYKLKSAFEKYCRNKYFPPALQIKDCKLYASVLVVDYRTGDVLGHFCNHTDDLTSFGSGFPISSLIKPFILLQMLEEGIPVRLFDGKIHGKRNPENGGRAYLNEYVGVETILSKSLNAPVVNIREVCNPLSLFKGVEDKFADMGISPQTQSYQDTYNYALGSRLATIWDITQAYQCLLSDGMYKELSIVKSVFNPVTNKIEDLPAKPSLQLYSKKNTDLIKNALTQTLTNGTAMCLKDILPKDRLFYIKTGTSNDGANHGYTVLADDNILIVCWLSYGRIKEGKLQLNNTFPIPYISGGKSAGVFAAYVYNEFLF